MESHPYTKPRGVGPVTTQLTPGAEPASCPLRGSPQAHPAHGPVHQHAERGANPLCHLLQIQSARVRAVLAARAIIVDPRAPPFYTSSLTSPAAASELNGLARMIQFGSAAKNFAAPCLNPLHQ